MQHNSKNKTSTSNNSDSKTQGVGRLTIQAVLAITNIVESVHKNIRANPSISEEVPRSGISGLVYRNIRNLTALIGKRIDAPLAYISSILDAQPDSASSASYGVCRAESGYG